MNTNIIPFMHPVSERVNHWEVNSPMVTINRLFFTDGLGHWWGSDFYSLDEAIEYNLAMTAHLKVLKAELQKAFEKLQA